ncbi:hypothetical protein ACQKWADRAFT_236750 [Trichoderma austrokoningii]
MTTVPQLIARQSQPQGQCQEHLMQSSRSPPPPLGQYNDYAQIDAYDDPPGSPQMKAVHPKLELTESPPPDIPIASVSLPPIDGNAKSNRPKLQPVSGDTVLITYLANGRLPEIAQTASRQALAGGDDFETTEDDDDDQKSVPRDGKLLADADYVHRPQTARSDGTYHLQAFAAGALAATGELESPPYHSHDKDLTASTGQLSIRDDVPNHFKGPPPHMLGGGRHGGATENGSQSLLSPESAESGELAPLQIASSKTDSNSAQNMSLPSIRELNIRSQFPPEMPPPSGDRDLSMRPPGDARAFPRSSNVGVSRLQSMPVQPMPTGGRVSPPVSSPSEGYQRSFPSPSSLASSPYGQASSGSSHRSPADYHISSASNKNLQPAYLASSSPAAIVDRMSIDGITNPQVGGYKCTFDGCTAAPFQTQYLLNSHANVHSSARPHYCPVKGCPRAEGGKGFKRKNEMIRHGLVHDSPGYVCPFCADREHKYPRPDNLQRYVVVVIVVIVIVVIVTVSIHDFQS